MCGTFVAAEVLEPTHGWAAFRESEAVVALVWERLSNWQYMNLTSNSSIWGASTTDAWFYLWFSDEGDIVEAIVELGPEQDATLHALLHELNVRFGVQRSAAP